MNIPQFLKPTELSDRVLAERYARHPGPYAIAKGWQQDLGKIFPGIMDITYDPAMHGDPGYGQLNPTETELLHRVVTWLQPGVLVEFGTAYGRSTKVMAEQSPGDAQILTVDLPDDERATRLSPYTTDLAFLRMKDFDIGQKYSESALAYKVQQERMDATSPEFRHTLDTFLGARRIDFALIDAAHDYYTTKVLFELALPRMSHGGVIMTDDYNKVSTHLGVTEFFATKAREEGFVFYHFSPMPAPYLLNDPRMSGLLFLNLSEAKGRDWKEATLK